MLLSRCCITCLNVAIFSLKWAVHSEKPRERQRLGWCNSVLLRIVGIIICEVGHAKSTKTVSSNYISFLQLAQPHFLLLLKVIPQTVAVTLSNSELVNKQIMCSNASVLSQIRNNQLVYIWNVLLLNHRSCRLLLRITAPIRADPVSSYRPKCEGCAFKNGFRASGRYDPKASTFSCIYLNHSRELLWLQSHSNSFTSLKNDTHEFRYTDFNLVLEDAVNYWVVMFFNHS